MCGIVGKLNVDRQRFVSHEEVAVMNQSLSHRGPDDEGVFIDGNVGLGHRRLSIIDLSSAGHQPMSDREGKLWLTFNGEIYNFKSLRKELEDDGVGFLSETDSEVIIYLYKKYGAECVTRLRGMFAFAIWDVDQKELFLARDRAGQKPLKFYYDGKVFIFASELKAIFTQREVTKEIDWEAVDAFLSHQFVPHPKTGFKNIQKLAPAHYMIVRTSGEVVTKRYSRLETTEKLELSTGEWKARVSEKLQEAVKIRLMSDVPLGGHLSGGIDSSLIVALMAKESTKVKTFSIGFEEQSHNELPHAKVVAERFGTEHHEFVVRPDAVDMIPTLARQYEEPFADPSALPTWYLSKLTREHVTVALNGDGGDELFGGYTRYKIMRMYFQVKRLYPLMPLKAQLSVLAHHLYQKTGQARFRQVHQFIDWFSNDSGEFYQNLFGCFTSEEKKQLRTQVVYDSNLDLESLSTDWLDRLTQADRDSYLPDDLLVKVDMASMAHALEARSPFLDQELIELVSQMPTELKIDGAQTKQLLRTIAGEYLPDQIVRLPKKGFGMPLDAWFRNDLYDFARAELLDESFIRYGFSRSFIQQLLDNHRSGFADNGRRIWALLMLRAWLREWFEG